MLCPGIDPPCVSPQLKGLCALFNHFQTLTSESDKCGVFFVIYQDTINVSHLLITFHFCEARWHAECTTSLKHFATPPAEKPFTSYSPCASHSELPQLSQQERVISTSINPYQHVWAENYVPRKTDLWVDNDYLPTLLFWAIHPLSFSFSICTMASWQLHHHLCPSGEEAALLQLQKRRAGLCSPQKAPSP